MRRQRHRQQQQPWHRCRRVPRGQPPLATAPTTTAPPALVAPPPEAPPGVCQFLRRHIRQRDGCNKCDVARGPDDSVRLMFAAEGGRCGHSRDVSAKRACPLAEHAISAHDGVLLLEQYERSHGVKLTNKKQKRCNFMKIEFGVERLGKPPSFQVTLYREPRVSALVSVAGGGVKPVKLDLQAIGHKPVSQKGTYDNFMGFNIID